MGFRLVSKLTGKGIMTTDARYLCVVTFRVAYNWERFTSDRGTRPVRRCSNNCCGHTVVSVFA